MPKKDKKSLNDQVLLNLGLGGLDLATTKMALNMGLKEGNPLAAPFISNTPLAMGVKIAPLIAIKMLEKNSTDKEKEKLKKAMKILNGIALAATINNLFQMARGSSK